MTAFQRGAGKALALIALIAVVAAVLWFLLPKEPEGPRFALPVDCDMGRVCVVQNYVDMDPGPEARDQTCGPLSYDGHKGVDIRVPSYVEMREGVAVLAAAPGVVKALRNDMDDISVREIGREVLQGRDAGNAVVIDHGDGWESQYSHLRKGSVVVAVGQEVEAGDKLGLIGLSGNTEFPHLHFSVRRDGKTLDPFTGLEVASGCGKQAESLWQEDAAELLAYRAGGLLIAGFADEAPDKDALLDGAHRETALSPDASALVFWAVAWGLRGNDREEIQLIAPDGEVIAQSTEAIPRDKAQWFRYIGRKRRGGPWPPGEYRGLYRITRPGDGSTVVEIERTLVVR